MSGFELFRNQPTLALAGDTPMRRLAPSFLWLALAGLMVLPPLPARAQSQGQPPSQTIVSDPYQTLIPSFPSDYWGFTSDPYGGYLQGGAAVIRAQGQFLVYQQVAAN